MAVQNVGEKSSTASISAITVGCNAPGVRRQSFSLKLNLYLQAWSMKSREKVWIEADMNGLLKLTR